MKCGFLTVVHCDVQNRVAIYSVYVYATNFRNICKCLGNRMVREHGYDDKKQNRELIHFSPSLSVVEADVKTLCRFESKILELIYHS